MIIKTLGQKCHGARDPLYGQRITVAHVAIAIAVTSFSGRLNGYMHRT